MMTTARKSFALSLAFHTLMGSLGFWVLTLSHTPPPLPQMESRRMVLVPLTDTASIPRQLPDVAPRAPALPVQASTPAAVPMPSVTPPQKAAKTPSPEPRPAAPSSVAAPESSVVAVPSEPASPPRHTAAADALPPPPQPPAADLASEKKAFFASLRAAIQNHLRYPPSARRRGMQGEVSVRFTLLGDGRIEGIAIQRGSEVFHNAARSAVASASGIAVPKPLKNVLPETVELTLEFRLSDFAG